jgi:hypothetical protein
MCNKNILTEFNSQQRREHYIKKYHIELYNKIINFNVNYIITNFSQKCYHYYHNITEQPHCKMCENKTKFKDFNFGYHKYCSKKCTMSDSFLVDKRNKKTIQTNIERYGVDNPMKVDFIKDKLKIINIKKNNDNPQLKIDIQNKKISLVEIFLFYSILVH